MMKGGYWVPMASKVVMVQRGRDWRTPAEYPAGALCLCRNIHWGSTHMQRVRPPKPEGVPPAPHNCKLLRGQCG